MTRILLISRCPPYPLHLGDRLIVYHLARELQTLGVTVDLIAFAENAADWSLPQQQHYNHFFDNMTLFDTVKRPTPELLRRALFPPARFPNTAGEAFAPEMWREIERHLARHDYDAIHLFGGVQVYDFAGCLDGLKTVITPYESYSLYLRRLMAAGAGGLTGRLRLMLARNFESWMFSRYAVTTVVSDKDRDELLMLNPTLTVAVIPNGIDLARFTPAANKREAGRVMFLGNYEYAPNLDAALWLAQDIFPQIRAQIPDARLWLVGNAPPPELTALASDAIEVTGRVEDVRPYFAAASVFVCPLRVGAGIKNKVLEALASGCPVVATPLSVDGIAVKDDESALIAETAEALAAGAVRLLREPQTAVRLRQNGRALIETGYSWRGVVAQYAALYTD